jgi:DNA-binding NarL/FixJ family response regulator
MNTIKTNLEPYAIDRKVLHRFVRPGQDATPPAPRIISMISGNPFENEVMSALLQHVFPETEIRRFATARDWRLDDGSGAGETVIYNIGDHTVSEPPVKAALKEFIAQAGVRHVVVISRNVDTLAVFDAIDCGASSYISSDAKVDELVEALRAPSSSSIVIPRSSMASLREAIGRRAEQRPGLERYFTERQLDVARALRRGDANKTIAYELGLCESTVKVHIRNIMRKLKATNRTQAAFRLNELASGSTEVEVLPDD